MLDRVSLGVAPELPRNAEFENAKKVDDPRGDLPNFEKLMAESNGIAKEEFAKEKVANGGSDIRIGETKDDKAFRDQLEKITGKKQERMKNKLEKDDYLNLMVTQMRYQDPTKPMENQEMASQMAQFNSVEQMIGMNKLLTQLNETQLASRGDKLTQYLGMNVELQGNNLKLSSAGVTNDAFVDLPVAAGTLVVSIKDSNGVKVKNIAMSATEIGRKKIEWDGTDDKGNKLTPGVYNFSAEAASLDGKPITVKTSMTARVEAITALAEGGKLDTTAGVVEPKSVIAVRATDALAVKAANVSANTETKSDIKADIKADARAERKTSHVKPGVKEDKAHGAKEKV